MFVYVCAYTCDQQEGSEIAHKPTFLLFVNKIHVWAYGSDFFPLSAKLEVCYRPNSENKQSLYANKRFCVLFVNRPEFLHFWPSSIVRHFNGHLDPDRLIHCKLIATGWFLSFLSPSLSTFTFFLFFLSYLICGHTHTWPTLIVSIFAYLNQLALVRYPPTDTTHTSIV